MSATQFSGKVILPNTIPSTALSGSVVSSSYAATASYATNAGAGAGFPYSGSAVITGSLYVVPTGSVGGITGSFTGSLIGSASYAVSASYVSGAASDWATLNNKPTDLVSSSTQVKAFLPDGTVSASAQYPGWVTASSQIVWSSVNYNGGIISSSAQTVASIAGQVISPSSVTASGGISGSFVSMSGGGFFGGNVTVNGTLTAVSQSVQYVSSSQFNVATNKIIVNTTNALRYGGISVIDSSSVTNSGSLYWDSFNNRWLYENVSGEGPYNSAIIIAGPKNTGAVGSERGLVAGRVPVATGDDHIDTEQTVSSSIRVDFTNRRTDIEAGLYVTGSLTADGTVTLAGIPSSSAQVKILLPNGTVSSSTQLPAGTVSSSAQYPGWVTSSTQIVWSSVNYNTGIVSSSTQVQPLLPGGTVSSSAQYPGWVTASSQIDYNSIQNKLSGVVSSSTQVAPLLPGGTVSASAQYPGWVTASSQIDYNSIQNKLSGVVSSSTQVQPLLPGGTVSSSAQYPGWVTASSQIVWASVNYNGGIVSSSAQVAPLLPGGTVSSSAQYPGWVTASSQIVWSSVNYNANIISSSTQFKTLTDPFSGSFTGSFKGDGSGLTGISVTLFTGSAAISSSVLTTTGSITVTAPATANVNLNTSNFYIATAAGTGTITWTVTGAAASGLAQSFIIRYTNGGSVTNTWFTGTKWSAGTAPTLSTAGVDLLGFVTDDGGTTWRGVLLQRNSS